MTLLLVSVALLQVGLVVGFWIGTSLAEARQRTREARR